MTARKATAEKATAPRKPRAPRAPRKSTAPAAEAQEHSVSAADMVEATAPRDYSKHAPSIADAAKVLSVPESEVASVDKADEGTVATTTDGQRYLLNDDGTAEWLRVEQVVPQILKGE